MNVSIVIPVKNPKNINAFIDANKDILLKYHTIVIDSGGGELLKPFSNIYLKTWFTMSMARKLGYSFIKTQYTLNLDIDNILPNNYIENAIKLLSNKNTIVVAIDYEKRLGHYGFGTSLWKTKFLINLYDYNEGGLLCECVYMWRKVLQSGNNIETLPCHAKNLGVKSK